jgi:hypothetical protein
MNVQESDLKAEEGVNDTRSRLLDHVDMVALGEDGPYRLALGHRHGTIVEYFSTTEGALRRLVELERLLDAAQGFGAPEFGALGFGAATR